MSDTPDPRLKLNIDGHIAIVTIDRADKLNALDDRMVSSLHGLWRKIEHNSDIRAVIITGAGEKAFSAGGDTTP